MRVTIRRCLYWVSGIHAARAAAALKRDLGVEIQLENGSYGEFTLLVDGKEVPSAGALGFLGILPSAARIKSLIDRNPPSRE